MCVWSCAKCHLLIAEDAALTLCPMGTGSGGRAVPPVACDWKKQFDFAVQPQNKTPDLCSMLLSLMRASLWRSGKYCNSNTILIMCCRQTGRCILCKPALNMWRNTNSHVTLSTAGCFEPLRRQSGNKYKPVQLGADRKHAEIWIGHTFSPKLSEKLDKSCTVTQSGRWRPLRQISTTSAGT